MPDKPLVPFIVGPTGVGKTAVSIEIARKLPVEIVSADSRQIYRFLDIGTAKPSKKILNEITHHFIDFLRPDEYFSAGMYSQVARKVVNQIIEREKIPLVVGGSGLYIRALCDGLINVDVRDEKIRNSLRQRLLKEGVNKLYSELKQIDPSLAKNIKNQDRQRIIRGLEVYLATGKRLSSLQEEKTSPADFTPQIFGLTASRDYLYKRINQRVDEMIESGFLAEIAVLKSKGFNPRLNALNTVGYKEIFEYTENQLSYDEMIEQIKRNTRRYAKRQMTWFRKDERIQWLMLDEKTKPSGIAKEIMKQFKTPKKSPVLT